MELQMHAYMQHLADQQAANHWGQMQLNDSFYQYTLHQNRQDPNPYPWPTPEQFRVIVAWPGDMPNFQEEASSTDAQGTAQGDEGGAEDDGDMAELLDFFIRGGWAPRPCSSKFPNLSLSYLLLCYVICCDDCLKRKNLCMVYFWFIFAHALMFDGVVLD